MKIKKILTATLAAVLCVTGVSFSASAVEPRHEHEYVCIDENGIHTLRGQFVDSESICYIETIECTMECSMQGCGKRITRIYVIETGHDWSQSSTCAVCGRRHPTDIDSAETETHTH